MEATLHKLNNAISNLLPSVIKIKLKNITEKASVGYICPAPRVAARARFTIPYNVIKQNSITLEHLQSIKNGVVIVLENEDYTTIKDNEEALEKYCIENIGGDNNVSVIVGLYNTDGTSSSFKERKVYEHMESIIKEKDWKPVQRKENYPILHGQTYIGNFNWEGELFIDICGGDQTDKTIKTHPLKPKTKIKSEDEKYLLFNEYNKGYMDTTVGIHTISCLIYLLLHSTNITNFIPLIKVQEFKDQYSTLLKLIDYDEGNLYNYCHCPIKKFIVDGILQCPLDYSPIDISQFEIKDDQDQRYLQICHNEAASKKKVYFDNNQQVFLTDYRPTNMFWGTHQGNMEQQTFTIEEYQSHIIAKAGRMMMK